MTRVFGLGSNALLIVTPVFFSTLFALCNLGFTAARFWSLDNVFLLLFCFFFKQKTAYEMRISDWSSDVCSSDLTERPPLAGRPSSCRAGPTGPGSVVAVGPLHSLGSFLGFQAQRRDGTSFQPPQADRLVGFLAVAIGTVLDPLQRGVDLADQLAFTITSPKLDRVLGLERGPVGHVRLLQVLFCQVAKSLVGFPHQLGLPAEQLLPEIFQLLRVHELFIVRRSEEHTSEL